MRPTHVFRGYLSNAFPVFTLDVFPVCKLFSNAWTAVGREPESYPSSVTGARSGRPAKLCGRSIPFEAYHTFVRPSRV